MKTLVITALFLVCAQWLLANPILLQDALNKKQVKLTLKSNGKHLEEGMITAEIQNLGSAKMDIKIPVGTRFISEEDDRQDLILVKEEHFALAPNQKKTFKLVGMCIQSSNRSPGEGASYKLGQIMTGHLTQCANFIHSNKIYNSAGQEAIWAFSDNHDLAWIQAENEKEAGLRKLVAELKGVPDPWYTTRHDAGNNQLARNYNPSAPISEYYNMTSAEIRGDFKWSQAKKGKLTFAIYDEENNLIRQYFENKEFNKGEVEFKFHYRTSHIKRGTYFAVMKQGDLIVAQQQFTF